MSLAEFLDDLVDHDGAYYYDDEYEYAVDEVIKPRILVIDQFEEILTTNSDFWEQRDELCPPDQRSARTSISSSGS